MTIEHYKVLAHQHFFSRSLSEYALFYDCCSGKRNVILKNDSIH